MTLKTCTCGALSKCEEAAADLLRERDAWRKDAERYRWLRTQDKSTAFFVGGVCVTIYPVYPDVQTLDAAIDAAMEAELDELTAIGKEIGDYD